jgi:hypothetical protein
MEDENTEKKLVIEVSPSDSVIVLHDNQTISLYCSEVSEVTEYYAQLVQFVLTDEDLLPEMEDIFEEQMSLEFSEDDSDDDDENDIEHQSKRKELKDKKWAPHELN